SYAEVCGFIINSRTSYTAPSCMYAPHGSLTSAANSGETTKSSAIPTIRFMINLRGRERAKRSLSSAGDDRRVMLIVIPIVVVIDQPLVDRLGHLLAVGLRLHQRAVFLVAEVA